MITYAENYFPSNIEDYENISNYLNLDIHRDNSDEEVWEIARNYEKVPNFESLFMEHLLSCIQSELELLFEKAQSSAKIDFYINGALDTHLYISLTGKDDDYEEIYDYVGFLDIVKNYEN